jgi:hypothetical protein
MTGHCTRGNLGIIRNAERDNADLVPQLSMNARRAGPWLTSVGHLSLTAGKNRLSVREKTPLGVEDPTPRNGAAASAFDNAQE